MKTRLSRSISASGWSAPVPTNCGRKARKKIDSLGLRRFIATAAATTCRAVGTVAAGASRSGPASRQVCQAIQIR